MLNDFFKLYRSILDHWVYEDSDYLKIWLTMLCRARYIKDSKTGLYNKIQYTLNYGQFIFGRKQWSKDLNIGEQKIRTCVNKLIKNEMIVNIKTTSKFTIFEIINYAKFNHQDNRQETEENQGVENDEHQQTNHQITTTQPPGNHQVTTNEESNKDNKDKKGKNKTNIYDIFTSNGFGGISPIAKETIDSMVEMYTQEWVETAIGLSVKNNVRKLSYVDGILKRAKANGGFNENKVISMKGGNYGQSAINDYSAYNFTKEQDEWNGEVTSDEGFI